MKKSVAVDEWKCANTRPFFGKIVSYVPRPKHSRPIHENKGTFVAGISLFVDILYLQLRTSYPPLFALWVVIRAVRILWNVHYCGALSKASANDFVTTAQRRTEIALYLRFGLL